MAVEGSLYHWQRLAPRAVQILSYRKRLFTTIRATRDTLRLAMKSKDESFLEQFVTEKVECFSVFTVCDDRTERPILIKTGHGNSPMALIVWRVEEEAMEFAALPSFEGTVVRRISFHQMNTVLSAVQSRSRIPVSGFATVTKVSKVKFNALP